MWRRLNQKLLGWLAKRSGESEHEVAAIELDERGIRVSGVREAGSRTLAWREIDTIVAVRRELLSQAVIGMLITSRTDGVLELHEGVPGWERLARELVAHLPGALSFEAWYPQLAFSRDEPFSITLFPVKAGSGGLDARMPST